MLLFKPQLISIALLLMAGIINIPVAKASSVIGQISPNQPVKQGLQFNLRREQDKNPQQAHFNIEIIPQKMSMPAHIRTSLSIYHKTKIGESLKQLRPIVCTDRHPGLTCNFTVPLKDLRNPELVFLVTAPIVMIVDGKERFMPSESMMYLPLRNTVNQ